MTEPVWTLNATIDGILQREGSAFTDDPVDKGGATKYGVTLRSFQQFTPGATVEALQALDAEGARAFYRWYLKPFTDVQVDTRVWVNLLDAATLHGPTGAVQAVQHAVGTVVDGVLGSKTIAALQAMTPDAFCLAFAKARVRIMVADVRHDLFTKYGDAAVEQTDVKYLLGWMERVLDVAWEAR